MVGDTASWWGKGTIVHTAMISVIPARPVRSPTACRRPNALFVRRAALRRTKVPQRVSIVPRDPLPINRVHHNVNRAIRPIIMERDAPWRLVISRIGIVSHQSVLFRGRFHQRAHPPPRQLPQAPWHLRIPKRWCRPTWIPPTVMVLLRRRLLLLTVVVPHPPTWTRGWLPPPPPPPPPTVVRARCIPSRLAWAQQRVHCHPPATHHPPTARPCRPIWILLGHSRPRHRPIWIPFLPR